MRLSSVEGDQVFDCRGYPPGKLNNGPLIIWKELYSLGRGLLTQRVKYRHTDKTITCLSWEKFGQEVTFNLKLKAHSVFFTFQNLQQSKEKQTKPSAPIEQNIPPPQTNALALSEKHTKYDLCAVTINETSPTMMRYGIENQGATCFLNTVLQILFMTEEFREAVKRNVNNSSYTIINPIAQLFECLKSGTGNTEGITTELKINVHKQEDAAKCLQKILQQILKITPEISQIFQGEMAQTTMCINPANKHDPLQRVKTFFILSISLNSEPPVHMQKCFDSYFDPIIMCGEDQQLYCKDCEMMMKKTIVSSLQKVPLVLVLHLERFEFDYNAMCCVKNYSSVQIPPQLLVKEEAGVNHTYDLYAIANHAGSLNGGHYYADIKDHDGWYRFDDSRVNRLKNLTRDSDIHSDEAYLLLYKKCSKHTRDTFSLVSETENPGKRSNTLPKEYPKPEKIRRCIDHEIPQTDQLSKHICVNTENEHDSQSTVINEQDHPNNSDSDSETEENTSQNMPDDPVPDGEIKSSDAAHSQPTPNNSSGEMDCQSSESELNNTSENGKDQQDLQVLKNNSDSDSETEGNTSQTMPDDPVPDGKMKSITITIDDHNQPTPNNSSGVTESQSNESVLNNTSENGMDLQVLQKSSDSSSETEENTSQTMPDETALEMQSSDADHSQPTPNNSSGEMDGQFIESDINNESIKGNGLQDLQVLWNNSDSDSETEGNTSQTMPDDPVPDGEKSITITIDDHNQPTPNNSCGVTESELNNTSENGKDLQVLQKSSDSSSETEENTSQTMPDETALDMQSSDADHSQPTPNNSSGEMDSQSSESENEKGKDHQDLQVLQNESDSDSETGAHASQNMAGESIIQMQSNDGDDDNRSKLLPSADRVSEQHIGSCVSLENIHEDNQKQLNANNNETKRALYCIGISLLSVFVSFILCIVSHYYTPHLLIYAVVVLLLSVVCFLVLLPICVVSYLLPTVFTTGRNDNLKRSGVI